jgi:heme exporter protein B
MRALFVAVLVRDLRLAARRRTEALLPLVFFAVAVSLVPLGVGPEPDTLRRIAPGMVWVCALLASLLSLHNVYASDHADGSLEQMLLPGRSALAVVAAKAAVHWLLTGVPLMLAAPLLGLLFGLETPALAILFLSLGIGTPVLSLLGALSAALTLGLRSAGALNVLLVLPLAVPALVFGTGAVAAADGGQSAQAHCSLLAALLLFTLVAAPPAAAAALRIGIE